MTSINKKMVNVICVVVILVVGIVIGTSVSGRNTNDADIVIVKENTTKAEKVAPAVISVAVAEAASKEAIPAVTTAPKATAAPVVTVDSKATEATKVVSANEAVERTVRSIGTAHRHDVRSTIASGDVVLFEGNVSTEDAVSLYGSYQHIAGEIDFNTARGIEFNAVGNVAAAVTPNGRVYAIQGYTENAPRPFVGYIVVMKDEDGLAYLLMEGQRTANNGSSKDGTQPTAVPTAKPTAVPTAKPTAAPTAKPTAVPTAKPTAVPTAKPTAVPTAKPTAAPTAEPTAVPTQEPEYADFIWYPEEEPEVSEYADFIWYPEEDTKVEEHADFIWDVQEEKSEVEENVASASEHTEFIWDVQEEKSEVVEVASSSASEHTEFIWTAPEIEEVTTSFAGFDFDDEVEEEVSSGATSTQIKSKYGF